MKKSKKSSERATPEPADMQQALEKFCEDTEELIADLKKVNEMYSAILKGPKK
jgi:hypothetical protein